MLTCPSCSQENPAGFRFCGACATSLAPEHPAQREERKVVTVLFCDLVGSTARAERLDVEDVRAVLSHYHSRVRAELERFGGAVEKFIGDAVVALFGAPAAHEDDPERAVRAALAIRDWARNEGGLELRMAVNTGEALVTLATRLQQGEGMVAGDVVNTAARLQVAAPTNGIIVGEMTYRATRARIDYREAAPVNAKGKAEAIRVWEALEARSAREIDPQAHTPLIGRHRELRLLTELLGRTCEEHSPQLVTLVGPPGIGKSRLVYELVEHVEKSGDPVTWRQGRSLAYGDGGTFSPLAEIVKAHVGVLETDSAIAVREAVHTAVSDLLGDDRGLESHLTGLLGAAAGQRLQADQVDSFAAWRRFFEAVAKQRPLVLVFDDLQWADDGILDFVDYLVDWASGVPILVVATARPELLERRPAWGGGKLNSSTLALSPLTDVDSTRLIGTLLGRTVLAAEMQSALLDRIGGNPLYAEQYALLYREREPAEDLPLPESVQGIIAARLDVLSNEEKRVLQDAAVVGKVFWAGSIHGNATAVAKTLHALERKDFVRRERRSSVEGQDEFAFRHLLVRDVAYAQIPRASRAERHRNVAHWLETTRGDRDDDAELLADHYLRALELARAAGEVRPEDEQSARNALWRAGDHALRLAAFERAASLFEQALALSPSEDERPRLLLAYGMALQRLVDERGDIVLSEASELLAASGDVEFAGEAEAALAELLWRRGDGVRAAEHARRAVDLLRGSPPSFAKAHALSSVARIETFRGEIETAVAVAEEAVTVAADLGSDEILAHALNSHGTAKTILGDATGFADLERAVVLALNARSPEAFVAMNNLASSLLHRLGDVARSRELFAEARRLAVQMGVPHWINFFDRVESDFLFSDGDWDAVLALDAYRRFHPFVHLARGDLEAARDTSIEVLGAAHRSGRTDDLAEALALRLLVLRALRDSTAATVLEELVTILPSIARWIEAVPLVALALADLGRNNAVLGATEAVPASPKLHAVRLYACGDFTAAADAFGQVGELLFEALARLRGGERLARDGHRAQADSELDKAVAFFRKAGATTLIHEVEQLSPVESRRVATEET